MSNNLSQIEKLVLKGYFRLSEKTKQEEVEDVDLSKISPEAKEILDFKAQDFDFNVKILYFNLDSGRFIARGDDIFGESVIYGVITPSYGIIKHEKEITYKREMEFKKVYVGDSRHGLRVPRADSVDYSGGMEISKEKINCRGTWETYPGSSEGGTWELGSAKEST